MKYEINIVTKVKLRQKITFLCKMSHWKIIAKDNEQCVPDLMNWVSLMLVEHRAHYLLVSEAIKMKTHLSH
jgi:hypothetical protein